MTARDQIIHEAKLLCHRWSEESDLEAMQIAKSVALGINDWLEEDIFSFEGEIDVEDIED